jgi:isopenicillin N synthase-like dioxygenase
VPEQHNQSFIDLMEKYFSQPPEDLQPDIRPEINYQLGATPAFVELPRDHSDVISKLDEANKAHLPKGPDAKMRFFWRIGDRPEQTEFPELNAPPVVPKNFPNWADVMNQWGNCMLSAVTVVAEMTAVGLGLPKNSFTDMMKNGPHLLAPTGSDLAKYGQLDRIFAGFHYDLNFLTIHGKSRFPGLFIWLRDGRRCPVRVPDGCLLLQAGKQLEWLTGGDITAGYHEVVVTPDTLKAVEKAQAEGRPLWRVSSTLFSHIASDLNLKPLAQFSNAEADKKYPLIMAGKQVNEELALIKLGRTPQPPDSHEIANGK